MDDEETIAELVDLYEHVDRKISQALEVPEDKLYGESPLRKAVPLLKLRRRMKRRLGIKWRDPETRPERLLEE
jgi:hypothetical protein